MVFGREREALHRILVGGENVGIKPGHRDFYFETCTLDLRREPHVVCVEGPHAQSILVTSEEMLKLCEGICRTENQTPTMTRCAKCHHTGDESQIKKILLFIAIAQTSVLRSMVQFFRVRLSST